MTAIELCNLALASIGHDVEITSLDTSQDASSEASRCAKFYPRSRLFVITSAHWSFLKQPYPPAAVPRPPVCLRQLPHAYAKIADAYTIEVYGYEGQPVKFSVDSQFIHAEEPVERIDAYFDSDNPDDWPSSVQDAVVAHLAMRLAPFMAKSDKYIATTAQQAEYALSHAKYMDASSSVSEPGKQHKYAEARR
jgi:hypothetical protein